MWSLPELTWGDQTWRLPLCECSAAEFALALLDDENTAARRLVDVLQRDDVLRVWVSCRAGVWIESPPRDWFELASWLQSNIVQEFGTLRPVNSPQRERWAQLANRLIQPAATQSDAVSPVFPVLFGLADDWLHSCGSETQSSSSARNARWFPKWIVAAESSDANERSADSSTSNHLSSFAEAWIRPLPRDVELSEALPSIVQKVKRIRELESDFNIALEKEKLESLRQFAYGASHEINNPLANIATRAQTLLREEPDPERRRKLGIVVSQAFRAHEMISDLMLFAKPPKVQRSTWKVAPLFREVVQELSSEAAQQKAEICIHVNDQLQLTADRTQIAVALKALVRNSLEALIEGGRIDVSAELVELTGVNVGEIEICVRDNGPGIDPQIRRNIFDPFFSGREAGRGLGFGLPKCWRIVTAHGGNLSVESSPGNGTCFSIRLAGADADTVVLRTDEAHRSAAESHAEAQSSQRVG